MFVYALEKGVRMGYLRPSFQVPAQKAWAGIQKEFIQQKGGSVDLLKTIGGAGLGGTPYRDGSYNYYVSEKTVTNDPKGVGAYILAAVEEENANSRVGLSKTVLLDNYFNHEIKKDDRGRTITWHYVWDEMDINGYSIFGSAFQSNGARLGTLAAEPTAANLANASVYIIVDPDTDKETADPKYVSQRDADVIADWVRQGGVLALMANDYGNCDLEHFNILAGKFGIQFNMDSLNHVEGNKFEQGKVKLAAPNDVLKNAKTLYLKEISSLKLTAPATPLVVHNGNVIMATARYGKGWVFAVGDPWLYNEYTDGRKLPAEYQNFTAAKDLSHWLLEHSLRK
jgi:unsaturated rhamnogalacturonyl hydrolase